MEGDNNRFSKYSPKLLKRLALVFGVFVVVIIVIAMVVLLRTDPKSDSNVLIENYAGTNVPTGYKDVIQENISNILRRNSIISSTEVVDAEIREGSYKESIDDDLVVSKLIADVESLQYSFQVTVTWWRGMNDNREITDPDVVVECPYYTDVIYKDKKCIAQEPYQQIKRYLPYYQYLGSGQKFGVSLKQFNDEYYLAVEVKACGDENVTESTVDATKKWIKSMYMDTNDYRIETFDICRR